MTVLLIGGPSTLMNALIDKFNKNGHKVYLLTGQREGSNNGSYRRVFERYNFPYDSSSVREIFESVRPDVTLFMGAYDTNFNWNNGGQEAVRYTAALMNILSSFDALDHKGKFFYFSSEEVFCETYTDDVTEETAILPSGFKAKAIAQGEEMCENYRRVEGLQTFILRFDFLYWVPARGEQQSNPAYRMLMEALKTGKIFANGRRSFSMIFVNDAVEQVYQLVCAEAPKHALYNIASGEEVNEKQLARKVRKALGYEIEVVNNTVGADNRLVLSNDRFDQEFGVSIFNDIDTGLGKAAAYVKRHSAEFLGDEEAAGGGSEVWRKVGRALRIVFPYLENVLCFLLVYWLNSVVSGYDYFEKLDFYLLYVLLFAVVYGQQQAIFSGVLAVLGFSLSEMYTRSGFEILLDANTYVWIAQLFIVGLVVGYVRDRLHALKDESTTRINYLEGQLRDIKEINDSNVRIKQNYEAQVVNHKDSLGKIYDITTALEQYEPAEVLFYAAEAISKLMDCDDVAIYTVANGDFARLFSATSKEARQLGSSINYSAMHEMYDELRDRRVYINRNMAEGMPSMAAPVYSEDGLELILMLWNIPWERMTLGEANRLTIAGAMIRNAIVRANRYMDALQNRRYIEGTHVLDMEAFTELVRAFSGARTKGLTNFTLLEIMTKGQDFEKCADTLSHAIRQTDYLGILEGNKLHVLLTNTNAENAGIIVDRFKQAGYNSRIAAER